MPPGLYCFGFVLLGWVSFLCLAPQTPSLLQEWLLQMAGTTTIFLSTFVPSIFFFCDGIFVVNIHGVRKKHIEYIPFFSCSWMFIYLLYPNNVSHFLLLVTYFWNEQETNHVFFILMSFIFILFLSKQCVSTSFILPYLQWTKLYAHEVFLLCPSNVPHFLWFVTYLKHAFLSWIKCTLFFLNIRSKYTSLVMVSIWMYVNNV